MIFDPGIGKGWHYTDIQHMRRAVDPHKEYLKKNFVGRMKMRFTKRHVVIQTQDGLKIVTIPSHVKHSNEICAAAPHFRPGDEQFIKKTSRGTIIFDHAGRINHHGKEKREVDEWNEKSPLERFKHKMRGGK